MEIIQVTDKKTVKQFHKLPEKIYRKYPDYIPLIYSMVEEIFDPGKNAKFKNGDASRWILMRDGECIGRIAAFYDPDYAHGYDQPTGGCGFFECTDDQKAATLLFDTAKKWLHEKGMQAMDGPINFGENFFNWGLLIDGFKPQTFGMQYNPPYYRNLFENYGFRIYYEQYSYSMDITNPDLPERFWKIAAWVAKKPGYSFRHFTFKDQEKYLRDFMEIHAQAWGNHGNYKPIKYDQLKEMLDQAKVIMDEEFIWYVYHEDKPIAFFMMIPDLNQIIKKIGSGNMNLINILKLLYYRKKKVMTRCRVIVLGVIPKFQRMGIESGIFYELKKVMLRKTWYNDMEMSWVGDFNPKMNAMFRSFGADHALTHITYRYLFDRNRELIKPPIIG